MKPLPLALIVEPADLYERLPEPGLLIVDMNPLEHYQQAHIPDAVQLDYSAIVASQPPVMGLLPPAEQLSRVFSALGLTPETQVVAYDSEGGGKAGRLIYTLHAIGHEKCSWLNGGLLAWQAAGLTVESGINPPTPSSYRAKLAATNALDKTQLLVSLGRLKLLDTRTSGEFTGADVRAARGGHIPGAKNLDWTLAMDRANNFKLKPESELRALLAERGIHPDDEIVVYCQTHHRSAHTYTWLKALGYKVKGYPGAWSDWGNDPATPVEK